MQISPHFKLSEFTKLPESQLTPIQLFLLRHLCDNVLEPMRAFLSCRIKVTSGMRTRADYERLIKQGYHPSETSDHFFGDTVPLTRKSKIKRFGADYSYSVGAADIIPSCGVREAFAKMRGYFDPTTGEINLPEQNIKVGQLILEHGRTYWLHVSNPAIVVYDKSFVQKYLKKVPFLLSLDNGKTYQPVA